jgi:molecular chaperone DnaK (HSP70)
MTNYKTGRIYKIICSQSNDIYIGSTFNRLSDRFRQHKLAFNQYLNNNHCCISIFPYFEKYGIENFKIILIKEYNVCDKKGLLVYEQLWINKLNSINNWCAFQPFNKKQYGKLYYENNKDYKKQYYENNKDNIKDYKKQYRENNKDKIKQYGKLYYENNKDNIKNYKKQYYENNKDKIKQYYENNKDNIKDYKKQYYENNKDNIKDYKKQYRENNKDKIKQYYEKIKDKLNERFNCECGGRYTKQNLTNHNKTKKHIKYLEQKNN